MTRGNEIYVGSLPLIFQPNLLPSGLSVVNRGAGNPWGQISYSSCRVRCCWGTDQQERACLRKPWLYLRKKWCILNKYNFNVAIA